MSLSACVIVVFPKHAHLLFGNIIECCGPLLFRRVYLLVYVFILLFSLDKIVT